MNNLVWGNPDEQQMIAKAKREGGWIPFTEKFMVRLWTTPLDELRGTKPINERVWFKVFQPLLLEMAATDEGRELLKIPAKCGKIEIFESNSVHWRTGAFELDDNGVIRDEWRAIFKVGPYWGNIIRMKWLEFCKLAKQQQNRKKIYRPVLRKLVVSRQRSYV